MSGEPFQYKFGKTDELGKVAKKHGFKDWQVIWKHKKNAKLVSKRKIPKNLQGGDILYFPPTPAFAKATEKAIDNLEIYRNKRLEQRGDIEGLIAAYELNIKNFKAYISKCKKDIDKYLKSLSDSRNHVKKISTTVDVVQGLVGMGRGLKSLGTDAYKSTKLNGKELRDLNSKIESAVKKKLFWGSLDTSRKLVEMTKGTVLEPLHIMNESVNKVTSWNHWFVTVAALAEGESWSDAVTYDFDEAFKKHSDYMTIKSRKMFAEFQTEIALQERTVNALKTDIKTINKDIRACEDRAQYFMDLVK